MIPFLHIGWLTIPTFGLMVATALLVAGYILQADINRRGNLAVASAKKSSSKSQPPRGHQDEGFLIVTIAGIAGLVGARLYHVLETPGAFFADPRPMLLTRFGFAWFGGFLGGFLALIFLANYFKVPLLEFFDICSPAAAVGYAIGRIGCLLSGDGDYGRPTSLAWGMSFPNGVVPTTDTCVQWGWPADCRVHPTPIYEFLIWMTIAAFLWHMGTKAVRGPKAKGEIFCNYLILTGLARFLVEFLRINPRSFFGLSNAQAASIVSILVGAVLLWRIKSRYYARKQEHRIVEHITTRGDILQQEYHKPTPECPHPERWHMYDSMSAEVEVLDFLKALVTTLKPELVVETGTFSGLSTLRIAEGLKTNGIGKIITCEYDKSVYAVALERFQSSGLGQWIEARNESSLEMKVDGQIDFFFSDSETSIREQEVRRFLPQISPNGIVVIHDASSSGKVIREAALKMEQEGLLSVLLLPTPRGLVLAQKRAGRV
ncbi:MAG TPA: prolipoprotein diacylglyceryl transferase family protein [Candidatus Acidoferrum sp.]|nr:prolipoprotein diacylglyceryl transferase family protein [Candidatus Acidoferrum sp.]